MCVRVYASGKQLGGGVMTKCERSCMRARNVRAINRRKARASQRCGSERICRLLYRVAMAMVGAGARSGISESGGINCLAWFCSAMANEG